MSLFLVRIIILDFLTHIGVLNLSQFYFEHEHNVGNGEDLLMIVSVIFAVIVLNISYCYFNATALEFRIVVVLLYTIFFLIPIRIILSFGSSFINFIRGAATSNKFSLELFNDSMMLFVFLVRFSLQGIRIILIYIFYFSIHEFIFILPKEYITNVSSSIEH